MKRRLLSFIMLFAVSFCFINGCKNKEDEKQSILVVDGKEVIATINGKNYTADEVYSDLINSDSSAEYLYEELEDLLIKTAVPVTSSMRNRIVNEVEKWKKDVKENAAISGTSYKDALKSALDEEGVKSEDELIDKKIFKLQKEIITNQYWENSKDSYYKGYINNNYVYHISQILVSVSTNGNKDYFSVELTEPVAKKLYDVTNALLNGENFYQVAERYSDDTASKDKGGDMGLVTLNDSSLSSEIKYALASYSAYLENAQISHPNYFDEIYGDGIEVIPQEYVEMLGEKYDEKSDVYHITKLSDTVNLYARAQARNILFNNLYTKYIRKNLIRKICVYGIIFVVR